MERVAELGDRHEEEVNPVVNDGVVPLGRDGVRDDADEHLVVRQVGRVRVDKVVRLGFGRDDASSWSLWLAADGVNDRVEDVEEFVLEVELGAVDAEEKAGGEGGFDRLESCDFGFAPREDDLQELRNDRVDVVIEGTKRGHELW